MGPNVPVYIDAGQTLTDNGTVSFASGDTVTLDRHLLLQLAVHHVNGDLTADDTTINDDRRQRLVGHRPSTPAATSTGHRLDLQPLYLSLNNSAVYESGDLTDDQFDLPIYVPYGDVQYLANNAKIRADQHQWRHALKRNTRPELDRHQHGLAELRLPQRLHGGIRSDAGRGAERSGVHRAGQTLTDNGTVSFASGDTVTWIVSCCYSSQSITSTAT